MPVIDIDILSVCIRGDDEVDGKTEHGFAGGLVYLGGASLQVYLC